MTDDLESLLSRYLDALRSGQAPGLEDFARQFPDNEADLLELLPGLVALEGLKIPAPKELERLGEFELRREIGSGGMGRVYEAWQPSLGRLVALKRLSPDSADEAGRERFLAEARTLASLHHTHIVQIHGAGRDGDELYFVMELIEGASLDRLGPQALDPVSEEVGKGSGKTRRYGLSQQERSDAQMGFGDASPSGVRGGSPGSPLPSQSRQRERRLAELGIQAASALAHAHSRGVLHRDVKPANLLLDRSGLLRVADFGLAAALGDASGHAHAGTQRYLAPERLRGEPASPASDQYALGLSLIEILQGSPVHPGSSSVEELLRRIDTQTPELRGVSPELAAVLRRSIEPDPARRYPSLDAFAADLSAFLELRPVSALPFSPLRSLRLWRSRRPQSFSLAALSLLLGGLALGIFLLSDLKIRRALAEAEAQRQRAEANADTALKSLDRIFAHVAALSENGALSFSSPQSAKLLDELLPACESISAAKSVPPERLGELYHLLARLQSRTPDPQKALASFDHARTLLTSNAAAAARCELDRAEVLIRLGRLDEAQALRRQLAALSSDPKCRLIAALALVDLIEEGRRRHADSDADIHSAAQLIETLMAAPGAAQDAELRYLRCRLLCLEPQALGAKLDPLAELAALNRDFPKDSRVRLLYCRQLSKVKLRPGVVPSETLLSRLETAAAESEILLRSFRGESSFFALATEIRLKLAQAYQLSGKDAEARLSLAIAKLHLDNILPQDSPRAMELRKEWEGVNL
ncbi:MAG: Serine/threonine-protein kinase PrkC [Verrucomicrobiota bacterium]|jgi:serine/threonine protein kinase/multidrug efflux pump subunit AcrA (membrane-fusion protein)